MGVWASWDRRTRIFTVAVAAVAVSSVLYALILKTLIFAGHAVDEVHHATGKEAAAKE